jgi:hypothetical protein
MVGRIFLLRPKQALIQQYPIDSRRRLGPKFFMTLQRLQWSKKQVLRMRLVLHLRVMMPPTTIESDFTHFDDSKMEKHVLQTIPLKGEAIVLQTIEHSRTLSPNSVNEDKIDDKVYRSH